jgi:4-alpha-glucanotransferase
MKEENKQMNTTSRNGRSAGILMHITSLPGGHGTGDLGDNAYAFADFLWRSKQLYWQILPLNPVEEGTGYSPYSSVSAFAGNPLLISLDKLSEAGYLDKASLRRHRMASLEKADFREAELVKHKLLKEAFENFLRTKGKPEKSEFEAFIRREKNWLTDYALYVAIKKKHESAWYQWPAELRDRDPAAIRKFAQDHEKEILYVKWLQFIFQRQWVGLRSYCNAKGIRLFGDIPFYVSHDSADVWSTRDVFSLGRQGQMELVAGVPPDYFNSDGQLWGMPVYRWSQLKKQRYGWWVNRIRKNLQLFDIVRLDHFRAFSAYWAVPASEKTARNGKWIKGPGADLFDEMLHVLHDLPFVAEDLGDIDDAVHSLRERFGWPGMKVLHFAFSDNLPTSDYIPHNHDDNFFVYTGTHDNNTTLGWFKKDIGMAEKENLKRYTGNTVSTRTINTLLIRLALGSVSKTAIIPAQDILNLDQRSRMNSPATSSGNWTWRMLPGSLTKHHEQWLREMTILFNRTGM